MQCMEYHQLPVPSRQCASRFNHVTMHNFRRFKHRYRHASKAASQPVWIGARHPALKDLEDLSILDSRTYSSYLAGHIPGAVHVSWFKDCCSHAHQSQDAGHVMLETDPDVYGPMLEVWWALTVYGCDVWLLKGGYSNWCDQGHETELYEPCPLKLQSIFEASGRPWHAVESQEGDDHGKIHMVHVDMDTALASQGLVFQDVSGGGGGGDVKGLDWLVQVLGSAGLEAGVGLGSKVVFHSSMDGGASACMAAACWAHFGGGNWAVRL